MTDGDQQHDILCGSQIEVLVGCWDRETGDPNMAYVTAGNWLHGRYEARLSKLPVIAYMVLGEYSNGDEALLQIPVNALVRVRR